MLIASEFTNFRQNLNHHTTQHILVIVSLVLIFLGIRMSQNSECVCQRVALLVFIAACLGGSVGYFTHNLIHHICNNTLKV